MAPEHMNRLEETAAQKNHSPGRPMTTWWYKFVAVAIVVVGSSSSRM